MDLSIHITLPRVHGTGLELIISSGSESVRAGEILNGYGQNIKFYSIMKFCLPEVESLLVPWLAGRHLSKFLSTPNPILGKVAVESIRCASYWLQLDSPGGLFGACWEEESP
jgi:hypothetical protein